MSHYLQSVLPVETPLFSFGLFGLALYLIGLIGQRERLGNDRDERRCSSPASEIL
jgi:hypothetical protein